MIELLKSKEWSGKVIDCVLRFALSFALALAQVFGQADVEGGQAVLAVHDQEEQGGFIHGPFGLLEDEGLKAARLFRPFGRGVPAVEGHPAGVDEDEEAVNLVKYQNGYNLASKMIQTLTEIYDRLILETGV